MERLGTRAAIKLLAGLPPLQAEVILLRVVAGLDYEAVARLVGRSPGAVRSPPTGTCAGWRRSWPRRV
jgi:RNA polymerase sigma-70 factor, ECF subfamily